MRIPGMSMQQPGLPAGTVVPYPYDTDWNRVARLMVHESLKVEAGETVLLQCDPTYFPELTEQVRIEVLRAGAYEVGCLEFLHPGLAAERQRRGWWQTPKHHDREQELFKTMLDAADIYIWLPRAWQGNWGQTEDLLREWKGRSLHFHWVPVYVDQASFRLQSQQLERALFIDYKKLDALQQRLVQTLQGAEVHLTNPAGTDVRVQIPKDANFERSNGDASRKYVNDHARPGAARDRERELPCGLVTTTDLQDAQGKMVFANSAFGERLVGRLEVTIKDNKMTTLTAERNDPWVQGQLALEMGAFDAVSMLAFGTNPELGMLPSVPYVNYWGTGAGVVRLTIGDNIEAGGPHKSSFMLGHYLTDATVTANGTPILKDGKLVFGQ